LLVTCADASSGRYPEFARCSRDFQILPTLGSIAFCYSPVSRRLQQFRPIAHTCLFGSNAVKSARIMA